MSKVEPLRSQSAKPVVAVTGLEGRDNPYPGAAVARALRQARGQEVTLVGLTYDVLLTGCFREDLFDRVFLSPLPGDPPGTFLRRLLEIHESYPLDVIVPALDSELALYARYREVLLDHGIRMVIPSEESVRMRYKQRLPRFCRRHGIPTPRTEVIVDVKRHFERPEWGFPCFIKGSLADAERVWSQAEAEAVHARMVAMWGYPVLSQEPVNGEEYDICAVVRPGGEPAAMITIKKAATSRAGKAVAGIVVDDAEVTEVARHIIGSLQWEGPLELELVREESSGRFFLIEVNARFPAWVGISGSAGVNLPDLLLAIANGEDRTDAGPVRAGTMFVRLSRTRVTRIDELGELLSQGEVVPGMVASAGKGMES